MSELDGAEIGNPNVNLNKMIHHNPIHFNASPDSAGMTYCLNLLRELDYKVRTMESSNINKALNSDSESLRLENQMLREQFKNLQAQTEAMDGRLTEAIDKIAVLEESNKKLRGSLKKHEDIQRKYDGIHQKYEAMQKQFEALQDEIHHLTNSTVQEIEKLKIQASESSALRKRSSDLLSSKKKTSLKGGAETPMDPMLISASSDKTVKLWDFKTGSLLQTLKGHSGEVYSCCISSDQRFVVSSSRDKFIKVWDTESGLVLRTLAHTKPVHSCCISHDSRYIVSVSEDTSVRIWNAETGECLAKLSHQHYVYSCCISMDDKYVITASLDCTLKIWDFDRLACHATLEGHEGPVCSCCISADGQIIVSLSSKGKMFIWDVKTKSIMQRFDHGCYQGACMFSRYSCAISIDKRFIAISSAKHARIYEINLMRDPKSTLLYSFVKEIAGHSKSVTSCCFVGDHQHLVTTSCDKTIKIWDMTSDMKLVRTIVTGHLGEVLDCDIK